MWDELVLVYVGIENGILTSTVTCAHGCASRVRGAVPRKILTSASAHSYPPISYPSCLLLPDLLLLLLLLPVLFLCPALLGGRAVRAIQTGEEQWARLRLWGPAGRIGAGVSRPLKPKRLGRGSRRRGSEGSGEGEGSRGGERDGGRRRRGRRGRSSEKVVDNSRVSTRL